MTDERDISGIMSSGWFIALIAATWGVLLRWLIARRDAAERTLAERLKTIETDIADIKAVIRERGRDGRHTWPNVHD